MEANDLSSIETRLKALCQETNALLSEKELHDLLVTIRKPGWTTVAEVAFVGGIVEAMFAQSKVMAGLKHALLSGSAKVALNPQPLPPRG